MLEGISANKLSNLQKQNKLCFLLCYTICLALSYLDRHFPKHGNTLKNLIVFHFFHLLSILTLFSRLIWNSEHQSLQLEIAHRLFFLIECFCYHLATCNLDNSFSGHLKELVTRRKDGKKEGRRRFHPPLLLLPA